MVKNQGGDGLRKFLDSAAACFHAKNQGGDGLRKFLDSAATRLQSYLPLFPLPSAVCFPVLNSAFNSGRPKTHYLT
jgi:hypothetical protein